MVKRKQNRKVEPDSIFFLKILMFFIIGSVWVRFGADNLLPGIPIGLIIGVLFAEHDHFQIDRKIEFAILLAAAVLSFVAPIGIVLQIR